MLTPVTQNIIASLATVAYVKAVIGGCDFAVTRGWLAPSVSRKIIHVAAGSWIIFWPMFDSSHWTWRLNILVPAVYSVQLFIKGAILQDPKDSDVKTMSRSGKPIELCYGPLLFTLIMNVCGLFLFMTEEGIFIMACLGFGDGMAPLAGKYFPFGPYPTFPFGANDRKTWSGSLTFFVSSVVGCMILKQAILGQRIHDWNRVLRMIMVTTVSEAATGAMDNPFIALSAYVMLKYS